MFDFSVRHTSNGVTAVLSSAGALGDGCTKYCVVFAPWTDVNHMRRGYCMGALCEVGESRAIVYHETLFSPAEDKP